MIAAGENAAARALAWAVRDEGPLQLPACGGQAGQAQQHQQHDGQQGFLA